MGARCGAVPDPEEPEVRWACLAQDWLECGTFWYDDVDANEARYNGAQ